MTMCPVINFIKTAFRSTTIFASTKFEKAADFKGAEFSSNPVFSFREGLPMNKDSGVHKGAIWVADHSKRTADPEP